jgi:hypothetical protein
MRQLVGLLLGWCWLLGSAAAQQITLDPSPALACLTPGLGERGTPIYPFDAWKREESGRVKVELEFTGPDLRPAVKVLVDEGGRDFVTAVREHVATFRLPCLQAVGVPTRLSFDFVFKPDMRSVAWGTPVDDADVARSAKLECLQHVSGAKAPAYSFHARRQGVEGRVVTRLRFDAADKAPTAQVFGRPRAELLTETIEEWVKGYRLPCLDASPWVGAVTARFVFLFRLDGEAAYGFKPLTLTAYLGAVNGIQQQTLQLDTTQMGCPFDLRLQYTQPFLPNRVGEVGSQNPARQPLLQWLASTELQLNSGRLDAIFGDTAVLEVPCVKINLTPQEKKP